MNSVRVGISGRHAVLEALRSQREVHSVLLDKARGGDAELREVQAEASKRGMGVQWVSAADLVRIVGAATQGVGAMVGPLPHMSVKGLLDAAAASGRPALLVAVDGVEDPQNLGAIARSALLAGAHGLIVPERGTAKLGVGADKASAGAFSVLPVAPVSNLRTALESVRRAGVLVVGADANGGRAPWALDLAGGVCFVLGSEAAGLSAQAQDALDARACIPTPGGDLSLNVSAAAAVLLFEAVRQRRGPAAPQAK